MEFLGLMPAEKWLHSIAQFFNSPVEGNRVNISPAFGKGYIEAQKVAEGIDLVLTDVILNKNICIHRHKSENKGITIKYLIHTPTSFLVVKDGDEKMTIADGIYVSTSHSFDTNYIKAGYRFQVLSVILSSGWIQKHHNDNSLILNSNTIQHPSFIFEKISPAIQQLANNLFITNGSASLYKELLFNSSATELLAKTFSLFDYRRNTPLKEVIKNQYDINLLFEVREKLILNPEGGCPNIQSLSEDFGVSPTKLKTNFKIVFGKPIFQYFQEERMELAKKMIESGTCSVSDVGYKVGYTNLSKFSSAYKKHFGFTPKETHLS